MSTSSSGSPVSFSASSSRERRVQSFRCDGATFVVDAAFIAERLDANGVVVDIGRAHEALKAILAPLNYRNLDDLPEFKDANSTTEFMSKYIFDRLAQTARAGDLGRDGRELHAIRLTISESHVARAWYEAALW